MLQLRREGYKDVARVDLGFGNEFYFLMSPQASLEVAVEKSSEFSRRVTVPLFTTLELDRGIVYEQGKQHRRNKRLCLPSFESRKSLGVFYLATQRVFDSLRERWRSRCAASYGGRATIDLYSEMGRAMLDVMLRVTFGLGDEANSYDRADELSQTIKEYLERVVATANEVPPIYAVAPQLSQNYDVVVNRLLPKLRELVDDVIAKRRGSEKSVDSEAASNADSRADLLSILIAEDDIDDKEVGQILYDIIIAGSDTSASTLAAALYMLHQPKHQSQLASIRAEADSTDASTLPLEDLKSALPYTNAVAREALRLYPPVPFFGRTSVADAEVCGYHVPKGSTACLSPWYLGRDELAWGPSAADFIPERWLESPTGGADSSGQWLPFGAGPRGCLGGRLAMTEVIVGLARLLRDFSFAFEKDGELEFKYDITLNLEGSCICSIGPRKPDPQAGRSSARRAGKAGAAG